MALDEADRITLLTEARNVCLVNQEKLRSELLASVRVVVSDVITPLQNNVMDLAASSKSLQSSLTEDKGDGRLSVQSQLRLLMDDYRNRKATSAAVKVAVWGAVAMHLITVLWNLYLTFGIRVPAAL